MSVKIPERVNRIIDILKRNGYGAYAVGGCVRDSILGIHPKDWDVCTQATPEQMKLCFNGYHIIETGIKHGTLTVIIEGEPVEVTTYRLDGAYLDSRHPKEVKFIDSLTADLSRRDFTINAMAYNDETGLVDPFGGKQDLEAKLIKCVGDPDKRFKEDALRIIRALRFASVYEFDIDKITAESLHQNKELLLNIAFERINAELCKLLTGAGAEAILRNYADVIGVFIPEILPMLGFAQNNSFHIYNVWEHTIKSVAYAPADKILRLTMLFHDMGKPSCFREDSNGVSLFHGHPERSAELAEGIMHRLRFDKNTLETVRTLVLYHDTEILPSSVEVKRLLRKIGLDNFKMLMKIKHADLSAQNPEIIPSGEKKLREVEAILEAVLDAEECFKLSDLKVNGSDIISLGVSRSPLVGEILESLLDMVINRDIENSRDKLLETAKTLI